MKLKEKEKKYIYYVRTYRRIQADYVYGTLYFIFVVLPPLLLLVTHIDSVTKALCNFSLKAIKGALPSLDISIAESYYMPFGSMSCLSFDSQMPSPHELLINLIIIMAVISLILISSHAGKPLAVYLLFSFLVHIISCVYFVFETEKFVFTADDFSGIFMKQQIGIWILFIILMGIVTGFLGNKGLGYKISGFIAVLLYSAVFGVLRYTVFMFVLAKFSLLYMADIMFTFGPLFDFLYLVMIYSIYADRIQRIYDSAEGKGEWRWL